MKLFGTAIEETPSGDQVDGGARSYEMGSHVSGYVDGCKDGGAFSYCGGDSGWCDETGRGVERLLHPVETKNVGD